MSAIAPTHPSELEPCDVVMKGGVTSGFVYPAAVTELSTRYRFVNVGGTSVGAIAAALAAAAEYSRQRSGRIELRGPEHASRSLERPGAVLGLFAPMPAVRPLFDLILRIYHARGSRWAQSAALARAAVAYRPWPAGAAFVGVVLILVLLLAGLRHLDTVTAVVLAVVSAVVLVLLAVWTVAAPLVALGRASYRSVTRAGYGFATGLSATPGSAPALTDWLHTQIQNCAQLPDEQPLTFAMLLDAGITLQMVATDLGLSRPVTIPFGEDRYLFAPAEVARMFPPAIVDHVLRAAGVPEAERDSERCWFLPSLELPVAVGARISASVPLLLSSLRLYSARAEVGAPIESYLTDGGLTSNFPIHFFDHWLPEHPTFGLDLVAAGSGGGAAVYMPQGDEERRLPPAVRIRSLLGFLGRVQDASRNWRDELQAELPGFRDRICQIQLAADEGGFHLDAAPEQVRVLSERGRLAGREILQSFDWDRHRFTRYVTLMALLRENFALLAEHLVAYQQWPAGAALPFALGTGADAVARLQAINQATVELIERAATLPESPTEWTSDPAPAMRIGPRV